MAPPITKVQCRERWGGRGGCGSALLSCRHAGFFIPVSQLLPWTTDSMWHSSPGKKITIQTGMHCHIKPYFNWSLYNSLKSGPGAVPSLSSDMLVFIPWHWNMPQKDPSCSSKTWTCSASACKSNWTSTYLSVRAKSLNSFPRLCASPLCSVTANGSFAFKKRKV